jgi:hypothetical protein
VGRTRSPEANITNRMFFSDSVTASACGTNKKS